MPPAIWTEEFKVHSYEVDASKRVRLEVLARYFQEVAWNHAEALGVGFARLESEKKLWVLSRLLIEVDGYPVWRETMTVKTWPRPVKGAFALRDFEVLDANQQHLGAGSSSWLVLDAATRRPQRVDKFLSNLPVTENRRATRNDPDKLAALESSAADTKSQAVEVRYSDLDVNGHVNNARYIGWLVDSYPVDFLKQHQVAGCEMNYLGETGSGERVSIQSAQLSPLEYLHTIMGSSGEVAGRGRIRWRLQ